MNKHLKLFANHSAYSQAESNLDRPNVVVCLLEGDVHFNPYVETKLVAIFNVTNTSSATSICFNDTQFSEIEIDGIVQPNVIDSYTFNTTGEHLIKYTLLDPTSINVNAFRNCSNLISVTIPNSVTSIGSGTFNNCTSLTSITSLATTAPAIESGTFRYIKTNGTLIVPSGSTGYDVWMGTSYLGQYNWTKVEQ